MKFKLNSVGKKTPGDVGEHLGDIVGKEPTCKPPKKKDITKPDPVKDSKPAEPEKCPN